MAPYYQKPENALKRSEELIAVNQSMSALNLLHEILTSKRSRNTPLSVMEPLMLKFIELTVNLDKGRLAKEGLYAYKNYAQHSSVPSIENVIRKFLQLSQDKLLVAQQKADLRNLESVEDLEASETPESILLATVLTQDTKERSDREHLTPAFRFLWEAYRSCLDTLRNNARLEILYQDVAHQAFGFCLKYARKMEFRRLCDVLRQHLVSAAKYSGQQNALDLSDTDTLGRLLETRFLQLNAATELGHWQEGFKSIEDIYSLLDSLKKTPKASLLINYYEKLAQIFLVGQNYLFHAAAVARHYSILRQSQNLSPEEHQKYASLVLLSALAVPSNESEDSDSSQKKSRLLQYLRLKQKPTREFLLKEALSKEVFTHVRPDLKQLHEILEVQFHPLSICKKIAPIVKSLSEESGSLSDAKNYIKPLHQVILTRLLQQLSQVYSTVRIDFIVQLASFPEPYNYDVYTIERFVMSRAKRGLLNIRINHATESLTFKNDILTGASEALDGADGARLSTSQQLQFQLSTFAERLHALANVVDPNVKVAVKENRTKVFARAAEKADEERVSTYMRRLLIEKKKEKREQELAELEREEQRQKQIKLLKEQEAEKLRLEEQAKRREQERLEAQRREIEKQEAQKLAEQLAGELSQKNAKYTKEELEAMDTARLKELQIEQLEKERADLAAKSKALLKRFDYLERAFRREEIPLLEADYTSQQKADKEAYELAKKAKLHETKVRHQEDLLLKKRVGKIMDDYKSLKEELLARETEAYNKAKEEADKKLTEAKEARIKKVREERRLEKERQLKKQKEEESRKAEMERRKAEEAERQAKLDEIARKQREREAEIEAKLGRSSASKETKSGSSYVPPHLRQGGTDSPSMARTSSNENDGWKTVSKNRDSKPSSGAYRPGAFGRASVGENRDSSDRRDREPAPPSSNAYVPPSRRRREQDGPSSDRPASSSWRRN